MCEEQQLHWNKHEYLEGNNGSVQFSYSVLSMNRSTPGFPILHYVPECTQTHVH